MNSVLREDFATIESRTGDGWEGFRGKTVFMTGGTGFIGSWLTGSLLWANGRRNLGMRLVVLSRDPDAFLKRRPELAELGAIEFLRGDVREFSCSDIAADYVINAAAEASAKLNAEDPIAMIDMIVEGARRVSEFARQAGAARLLFLSSGAVYGKLLDGEKCFREDHSGAPSCLDAAQAYGEAKRLAELYTVCAAKRDGYQAVLARCFAFVGPYLPLDAHFAIGNFIGDGLAKRTIRINGDGKPRRSYMYAADLAEILIRLLIDASAFEAYNIGSDEAVSIGELAETVSSVFNGTDVETLGKARPTDRNQDYVPDIGKLKARFSNFAGLGLRKAIERTKRYYEES
jgi:nucleoside-diphosphate-sugar epimerase